MSHIQAQNFLPAHQIFYFSKVLAVKAVNLEGKSAFHSELHFNQNW